MSPSLLSSDDWQQLRDIRMASFATDPQAFGGSFDEESKRQEPEWRKRLENPDRFYVAIQGEEGILSIAGAIKEKDLVDTWVLVAVYTRVEHRGKGYSQQIVSFIIDEVRKRGAKILNLMVNTDQKEAVHVYEKMGFRITETIADGVMGDGKMHSKYAMSMLL